GPVFGRSLLSPSHRCALRSLSILAALAAVIFPLTSVQNQARAATSKSSGSKGIQKSAKSTAAPAKAPAKSTAKKSSGPWRVPNDCDSTSGDPVAGDDPLARQAAIDALGRLNGTVVVAEADTGRVLTIVNQKVAYRSGYQPCSTVKIPVALAALSESLVDRT